MGRIKTTTTKANEENKHKQEKENNSKGHCSYSGTWDHKKNGLLEEGGDTNNSRRN